MQRNPTTTRPGNRSSDGSWLRLNTTNYTSSITVVTKDGTTYTFPGFTGPFAGCNVPSCYGTASTNGNVTGVYAYFFSSMTDSTGQNTVTLSNSSSLAGATLTDTIGRTITFGSSGFPSLTYKDSGGNSQIVSIAQTQQTAQNYNFNLVCSPGRTYPFTTFTESYGYLSFSEPPLTYTVTLPAVNGVKRVYTLQFDGVGNLLQASYPEGGYTKYAYQDYSFYRPAYNVQTCSHTQHQVAQKRECTIASGCSSSQELVTTYTPTPDSDYPFNDYMEIADPLGDVTYVQNQNLAGSPYTAPHETSREIFSPGGYPSTPLRTIQTAYTPWVEGVDVQIPASVTTILNDISPNLSSVTNYQYETVTMAFSCFSGCGPSATVDINDQTEIDQYDYSTGTGTALKKTAQTWMNSSNGAPYSISGGHLLDRLATRAITDPATNNQATLSYGYNSVGDITSKVVGGTGVTSLTTSYQRDSYGNITQTTDPKSNVTKYGYTNNWANSGCSISASSAYLTSITDALSHVTKHSYYPCTGLKDSTTDPNNAETTYTYDPLGRSLITTYADGGTISNAYVDTTPNSVTTTSSITSTLSKTQKTILDGFGRTSTTQLTDAEGADSVDTTYDAAGRKYCVSNPYRSQSDSTYGITTTLYDGLDRVTQLQPPDYWTSTPSSSPTCASVTPQTTAANPTNEVVTTYYGNCTTVADEAGKSRESCTDALARLTKVIEDPGSSPHLDYTTNYGYDAFGNLLSVSQNSSRQRTFSYNTFSQLLSAKNPESGTISYVYDPDGNVSSKTAPLENQTGSTTVTTTFSYDALNRLTGKTYTDGTPAVSYWYDGTTPTGCSPTLTASNPIYRRTAMCDGPGWEAWSYNITGHLTDDRRSTSALVNDTLYTPNLDGSIASMTYPSGHVLTYTYDSAARPSLLQYPATGLNFAFGTCATGITGNNSGVCYAPQGAASLIETGSSPTLAATQIYNSRLQPCWI